MKLLVQRVLLDTPFEGVARWSYHRLNPSRNAVYNAKYDRETTAVMKRSLSDVAQETLFQYAISSPALSGL